MRIRKNVKIAQTGLATLSGNVYLHIIIFQQSWRQILKKIRCFHLHITISHEFAIWFSEKLEAVDVATSDIQILFKKTPFSHPQNVWSEIYHGGCG